MKKLTIATLLLTLLTVPVSARDCSKGGLYKCFVSKLPRPVKIIIIKVAK